MNFLITTFALLSLIALLAFSGRQQYIKDSIMDWVQTQNYENEVLCKSEFIDSQFRQLSRTYRNNPTKGKPVKPADTERETWVVLSKTPSHNRIDLGAISTSDFDKAQGESKDPGTWYHTAARLMRLLYGHTSFFNEIPHVEYLILDQIYYAAHPNNHRNNLKEGFIGPITKPRHLTAVPFLDDRVRDVFCKMLDGGKDYPSLYEFMTFHHPDKNEPKDPENHQNRKVSLHSASLAVLTAILDNIQIAQQLIAKRKELHEKSYYKTKSGTVYAKEHLTKDDLEQIARYEGGKLSTSPLTF